MTRAVSATTMSATSASWATHTMPVDTFGTQTVEPAVGFLTNSVSGGQVTLTWNGRPGVHLQSKANLSTGAWQDKANTDGLSTTNYPVSGNSTFYRLIKTMMYRGVRRCVAAPHLTLKKVFKMRRQKKCVYLD